MESSLEKSMEDVNNAGNVIGCILADQSGLCLGVKGKASGDSAGRIAAIADQAAKLEPGSQAPVISLQNDSRECLIHRQGRVVGAIYKEVTI
ncbi:uncharacterized protein LOC105703711 [Orussus abietinus]|uniref:uncharacterized protein LOC105703711 n=1 Tax=Orussus abietinus TaxID=222816 RepID=UPI0006251C5F|nr:uncharacterized protein LOC105703711 [Orussus abietinus]